MNNLQFTTRLVKGKIAETIFAQMLRETKEFTVLEFGYEKIIPELVQQGRKGDNEMIETLKTAPDFAVINRKTRESYGENNYPGRAWGPNVAGVFKKDYITSRLSELIEEHAR